MKMKILKGFTAFNILDSDVCIRVKLIEYDTFYEVDEELFVEKDSSKDIILSRIFEDYKKAIEDFDTVTNFLIKYC